MDKKEFFYELGYNMIKHAAASDYILPAIGLAGGLGTEALFPSDRAAEKMPYTTTALGLTASALPFVFAKDVILAKGATPSEKLKFLFKGPMGLATMFALGGGLPMVVAGLKGIKKKHKKKRLF